MVRQKTKADETSTAKARELHNKIENTREERINELNTALIDYKKEIKEVYKQHFLEEFNKLPPGTTLLDYLKHGVHKSNLTIKPNHKEPRWPLTGEILFSINGTPVRTN